MIVESLHISRAEFEKRTGWKFRPEGVCKGETCIPFPAAPAAPAGPGDPGSPGAPGDAGDAVDVVALSARLRMPLVHDRAAGLWCLGPESGGRTPSSARAPALTLPGLDGRAFNLDSLRGSKVLLVAWASW